MKKLIYVLCLLSIVTIKAQSDKVLENSRKLFLGIKSKPLCVVMDVEDEKFVNKLTKKGKTDELANYKKLIANNNAYLKSAVEKFFTNFSNVKYITSKELKDMSDKDLKKVNVLLRTFPMKLGVSAGASSPGGMVWRESRMESFDMDTMNLKDNSVLELRTNDGDDMIPIQSQNFSKLFYPYHEMCYAIRRFNLTITDAIEKRDSKYMDDKFTEIFNGMKVKTLIINRNHISKDLNEADIKTVYPYKFKLVTNAEYELEFTKSNQDVLILLPISFPMGMMSSGLSHTIFDSFTNYAHWPNVKKCDGQIEKKHFELYLKRS